MMVCYKVFRSVSQTWNTLFERAGAFASRIPPEWLISISHSADGGEGVVTVWFWATEEATPPTEEWVEQPV